jgi:hypothetical protein
VRAPGQPEGVPEDFGPRTVDFARRCLDDIPCCRGARYAVRWVAAKPLLTIVFDEKRFGSALPCLGVGLVPVNKGTLLEAYPGGELFRGDKLRTHLLTAVTDYLRKLGDGLQLAG